MYSELTKEFLRAFRTYLKCLSPAPYPRFVCKPTPVDCKTGEDIEVRTGYSRAGRS